MNQLSFVQIIDGQVTVKRLPAHSELSTVLTAFEDFLRGAGYTINGELDIYTQDTKRGS